MTVSDTAGNTDTVELEFPAGLKGTQTLTGFKYSSASVTFGGTAPTLTAPTGAVGALSYSASPDTVCTVDAASGALTLVGAGECEVTAKAAGTSDYKEASVTFTVTVQAAGPNTAPVFSDGTSTTRNVAENTASDRPVGAALSATDVDNDTLRYSLDGTDAGSFAIDDSTGQLRTQAPLDHETSDTYSLTVKADDGNGGMATVAVTVNVTDVEEPARIPGSARARTRGG